MSGALSTECLESNLVSFVCSVLSGDHDSESIEVSGLGSKSEVRHLLGSGVGSPFLGKTIFGSGLDQVSGSDTSEHIWNSKFSKSKSLKWIKDSWELAHAIDLNSD